MHLHCQDYCVVCILRCRLRRCGGLCEWCFSKGVPKGKSRFDFTSRWFHRFVLKRFCQLTQLTCARIVFKALQFYEAFQADLWFGVCYVGALAFALQTCSDV